MWPVVVVAREGVLNKLARDLRDFAGIKYQRALTLVTKRASFSSYADSCLTAEWFRLKGIARGEEYPRVACQCEECAKAVNSDAVTRFLKEAP